MSTSNIWQIKQTRPTDFEKGLIGFARDEKALLEATSPFVFSTVNERTMLRFLKLIACDNGEIGTYAKLVDARNETVHPNGNIFFSTQAALDVKITEILRVVDEIQGHSRPVIDHCYREFLLQNHEPEEREYFDPGDQIREMLIHGNYLSQKDIDICFSFDLAGIGDRPEIGNSSGPHHQDSGEAKIRESTAGVSRKPSSDGKACGCSSKHLCGLTAWNT